MYVSNCGCLSISSTYSFGPILYPSSVLSFRLCPKPFLGSFLTPSLLLSSQLHPWACVWLPAACPRAIMTSVPSPFCTIFHHNQSWSDWQQGRSTIRLLCVQRRQKVRVAGTLCHGTSSCPDSKGLSWGECTSFALNPFHSPLVSSHFLCLQGGFGDIFMFHAQDRMGLMKHEWTRPWVTVKLWYEIASPLWVSPSGDF